jgi:hypothetical protein
MEYETLEQLCKTVSNELNVANDKIRAAGGKLTQGDVQYLDQLTHMMKSIKTTMAMLEAEKGGSNRGSYDRSYEGRGSYEGGAYGYESNRYVGPQETMEGSYDEGSYARGRGRGARRDSMGRYM